MSKIEEIKRYIENYERRDPEEFLQMEVVAYRRIKFLLSSLEEEKKRADKAEAGLINMGKGYSAAMDHEEELEEKVKKLEYIMTCDPDHWDTAYVNWVTEKAEERIKLIQEHADKLGEIISGQTEKRLELEETLHTSHLAFKNSLLSIQKLQEKLDFTGTALTARTIEKDMAWEKVKELDDRIEKLILLIDEYAGRINKAEAQLASIKADESVGKLEVVDSFGEDD